jgi:hypothetical protein
MTTRITDRGLFHRPPCVFWVFLPVIILLLFSLGASFEYMPKVGKIVSLGVSAAGVVLNRPGFSGDLVT